ncbi:hypothetical protein R1sor_022037 [Riccia sorocarpa]|uniref:Mitochondrial carrier protein n=1 Tax=Riccia sorocarpa TaxID=122646 RepID=A0ABD3GKE6_9MARC
MGMKNGLITRAGDSRFTTRIANFLQQLPGELEGFRRRNLGLASPSLGGGRFKQGKEGIESLNAQVPDDVALIPQLPNGDDHECAFTLNGPQECSPRTERKGIISASKLQKEKKKKRVIQTSQHLLAGAVAAMVSRTIVAPLERLKLEYLVRGAQGSVLETVQKILKNDGSQLLKLGHRRKDITNLERLAAGAAAGVTATIICFPLDTIRTTMVAQGGEALGG